jgi:hypothetical protein
LKIILLRIITRDSRNHLELTPATSKQRIKYFSEKHFCALGRIRTCVFGIRDQRLSHSATRASREELIHAEAHIICETFLHNIFPSNQLAVNRDSRIHRELTDPQNTVEIDDILNFLKIILPRIITKDSRNYLELTPATSKQRIKF